MLSYSYQLGEFRFENGNLFYLDTQIADSTLQPVIGVQGEGVYVINVKHLFLAYPFVIVEAGRYPNIFKATEVSVEHHRVRFKEFLTGKSMGFHQFGPYEYPYEDSAMIKIIRDSF